MKKTALLCGVAICAAFATADAANAQAQRGALATEAKSNFARDRNISVRQRPRPEYDAKGLPLGGFRAFPKLSVTAEYNDNIYAQGTNEIDDVIWRIQPQVSVVSNWNRHGLAAYARATINQFTDNSSENTTDYAVGASGQLDVLRFTNVTGGVDYARMTEPRTTTQRLTGGLPFTGATEPVRFDQASAFVAASHEVNRLRLSGRAEVVDLDYEDADRPAPLAPLDQDYRDRTTTTGMLRADYALTPDTAIFVQALANKREYDQTPTDPLALRRDSDGYQLLAGANFELGALLRGEVALGYMEQEYDDLRFGTVDGFGARAELEWFPSQITTVMFTGARTIEDSADPVTTSFLSTAVGAEVTHEFRRNIILAAQASYADDEYEGVDRTDTRVNASLSATYLLNPRVGVTALYAYSDTSSSGAASGAEYTVNRVSATVTLQF